ncbi:MAG TPA: right-handed parallel beta-helix repeat-containing protein [Candidatus Sulfopaludibacter sp.]|nr:right-handed parallel beta-helix repeat-containing protein [Candidatus Sulfopaludibacter sp.]
MKLILTLALAALAVGLFFLPTPRRVVQLPPGEMLVHSPIAVGPNTELRSAPGGSTLRAAPDFTGRAVVVVRGSGVRLRDFTVDGNIDALEARAGLPPYDTPFARYTHNNGIFAADVTALTMDHLTMRNIAGFAVLVSNSHRVAIDHVRVTDSGSRNEAGRNNATGGILLEEGATDFRVTNCTLHNIRGNGVWTHSLYTSPRNARGLIALNRFANIGRDAIQVGHATGIRVEENTGMLVGFPVEDVDIENRAIPVAIDTAGNVEKCSYTRNRFQEINGKCIDLDGFHDGEVRENECVNRAAPQLYRFGNYGIVMNNSNPDMRCENIRVLDNIIDGPLFGGIFVIGTGHRIAGNLLRNLNTAHCNDDAAEFGCYYAPGEPDLLRSGIYLGRGAERPAPARGNVVEDNEITGYGMQAHCVVSAPGIDPKWNTVRDNRCK